MANSANKFGGIIWTNHALQRLSDRGIKQGDAYATFRYPENSRRANIPGAWVYRRKIGKEIVEVVAKKNEWKEWIVLSAWSKPIDYVYHKPVRRKGFWAYLWHALTGR
jgi:hypothetical protein